MRFYNKWRIKFKTLITRVYQVAQFLIIFFVNLIVKFKLWLPRQNECCQNPIEKEILGHSVHFWNIVHHIWFATLNFTLLTLYSWSTTPKISRFVVIKFPWLFGFFNVTHSKKWSLTMIQTSSEVFNEQLMLLYKRICFLMI